MNNDKMPAPTNNQFWKQRSKHGRNRIFSDPSKLWNAACEYFQWVDDNPWYKQEALKGGENAGKIVSIPTARPYTIEGLCLYLGVSRDTFYRYSDAAGEEECEGFSDIITRIRDVIYTQKFEGAAVGAFNANIIARELGLVDRKEVEEKARKEEPQTLEEVEARLAKLRELTSRHHR